MKRNLFLLAGMCFALSGLAQTDSTKKDGDTIRVGNILILKDKKDAKSDDHDDDDEVATRRPSRKRTTGTAYLKKKKSARGSLTAKK